jgi:flavin reductase (DIM6/NTAB) family NADH-FMN oxidoreductase RutF
MNQTAEYTIQKKSFSICKHCFRESIFLSTKTSIWISKEKERVIMKKKPLPPQSSMQEFPLNRAFTFFEAGPVLLVVTSLNGKHNVMTVSCHASLGFTPIIGCSLGPWNHSYETLLQTGECVLSIPTVDMMEAVVDIGNCSGDSVDKFQKFGLTPLKGKKVDIPLIAESLANVECIVREKPTSGDYYLFIMEGVKAWYNPDREEKRTFHAKGDGTFIIDGETINLRHKMTKWEDCI